MRYGIIQSKLWITFINSKTSLTEGQRVKQPIEVCKTNKYKTVVEVYWDFFILPVYQTYSYRFIPFRYQFSFQIKSLYPVVKLQPK